MTRPEVSAFSVVASPTCSTSRSTQADDWTCNQHSIPPPTPYQKWWCPALIHGPPCLLAASWCLTPPSLAEEVQCLRFARRHSLLGTQLHRNANDWAGILHYSLDCCKRYQRAHWESSLTEGGIDRAAGASVPD